MNLAELASGPPLDLVVIGGGINGCAIAEEAAARGLRTALFEAGDFGFGTTWRSTKLIHGGLRYLEHGDVRLVFESLRERAWLLKTRDYLVKPQRFVLPLLPWTRRPSWQLSAGLSAYDMLALYRGVPRHRRLSRGRLRELAPFLPEEARGGFTFYDARIIAPERLALELALEAEHQGAFIANHTAVEHIHAESGGVTAVTVRGDGGDVTLPAKAVINAAGPWVDAVNALGDLPPPALLGVTRGAHIVVELDARPGRDAVFSTAREDGRVFFSVPQGDLLLIGTTDDRYDGAPGDVRPTAADIEYLLREGATLLPGLDIRRERIRYAYAGLRPLQRVRGGPEAAISRRHAVIDHAREGGARGMHSVVGGKLSTFRPLAQEAVATLKPHGSRVTSSAPTPSPWRDLLRGSGLPVATQRHLRIYGGAISDILELGREPLSDVAHAVTGEVIHACRNEHATTLSDLMLRRTGISWSATRGLDCVDTVASLAAAELGWDAAERDRQLAAFHAELAQHLPTEHTIGPSQSANALA